MVPDTGRSEIDYIALATRELRYALPVRAVAPDDCDPATNPDLPDDVTCLPFQADPAVVTGDDGLAHDELTFTYDRQASDPAFERSAIQRVRLVPDGAPETRWRLDALDFQVAFPDDPALCANTGPCGATPEDPDATAAAGLLCHLAFVHDFEVLAEDASSVDLLIADTGNERVLEVHLDTASTCGVVTDALADSTVTGWTAGRTPNDVDRVALADGREARLVTFRSTNGDVAAGGVADGAEGSGLVMLFGATAAGWERAWTFPESGFLNSPHDSSLATSTDGTTFLVGAHSDGAGTALEADWGKAGNDAGSLTVAAFADLEAMPDYRYDVVTAQLSGGLGFVRSAHPYATGVPGEPATATDDWIVTDSGCMAGREGCAHEPNLRVLSFDLDEGPDSLGTGAFEPGRAEQTDEVASASSPVTCNFDVPYTVDLLWETGDGVPGSGEMCR